MDLIVPLKLFHFWSNCVKNKRDMSYHATQGTWSTCMETMNYSRGSSLDLAITLRLQSFGYSNQFTHERDLIFKRAALGIPYSIFFSFLFLSLYLSLLFLFSSVLRSLFILSSILSLSHIYIYIYIYIYQWTFFFFLA